MRYSFFLAFLFLVLNPNKDIYAQEIGYPLGEIVDSVSIDKTLHESYALYLPKGFKNDVLSPVVFIFHPAANGKHGIYPFIKAAETYNYVLVCSNDSKNGPYDENFGISNRFLDKVLSDFNIHPDQIYTAGFSGGARLAATIAILTGKIQGVVGCGAGFSAYPGHMPSYNEAFSYAGIIGNEDMNYTEMVKTQGWLDKLSISNTLFEFDMGHKWPGQDQMLLAFHWLALEANRKGIIKLSQENLEQIYKDFSDEAQRLEKKEEMARAHAMYSKVEKSLDPYFNLDSISKKIVAIEGNEHFKDEVAQIKNQITKEEELLQHYYSRLEKDAKRKNKLDWWQREIETIQKNSQDPNPIKAKMAKRLLANIGGFAFNLAEASNGDKRIFCHEISILIYPQYPQAYFRQMENHSNDPDKILMYLERLIATGYNDLLRIQNQKVIQNIGENQRLEALLKRIE